jgi:N-acetyl sugar amidotransferase
MDSSVPDIFFDENGVCNYCKLHDALEKDYPNDDRGKAALLSIARQIKKQGKNSKYDVAVGISGGTDSTYLLHIANELGLRVLAVHLDNGWDSEIAVVNIKNALEKLDMDLYSYVLNWEEYKDILLVQLKAGLPWADSPTDMAISTALYKVCDKFNIKTIFIGHDFRTEGKQPTLWTYNDGRQMRYLQKKFGTVKFQTFIPLDITDLINYSLIKKVRMIRPLYYIKYKKSDVKQLIKEKYDWKDYGGHHHENIFTRYIIGVWMYQKFGIDKRKVTYSAYIRNGEMSRQEATQKLMSPPYDVDLMQRDHEYVSKKLGIGLSEMNRLWSLPNRTFYDYPSYYPLYLKFRGLANSALRYLLPFKPMMTYNVNNQKSSH